MGQRLTNFDIKIIILLLFFMISRSIYSIFTVEIYKDEYTDIEKIFGDKEAYSVLNIVNIITAVVFLASSIYFFITNKIHNILFGAFCLFMFWRGLGIFAFNLVPGIGDYLSDQFIYYNMQVISILTLFFAVYLFKIILIG